MKSWREWWPAALLSAASLPFIIRRVGVPDYFWHELTGGIIVHHGIVRNELYTYTVNGAPWTDHEYGTQVLFYLLTRAGGLLAVSLAFALIVLAGFVLQLLRMRLLGVQPLVAGAAVVVGAAAGLFEWGAQPQMIDFLFLTLQLLLVERFLAGKRRALWWLPLIVAVWANLHGGFVFAYLVLAVVLATLLVQWLWQGRDAATRIALLHVLVVSLACVIASLLTPWGPSLFVYVWRTQFSSQLSSFIAEWQSPDFHQVELLGLLLMLILVLVGFALRRPRLFDVLLVVTATVLVLHAEKFMTAYVALVTPVLGLQLAALPPLLRARLDPARRRLPPRRDTMLALGALLTVIAVASAGIAADTLRGQAASTQENFPVAAADWLAAHPSVGTRVFNQFDWGGYLAYRFYPQQNRRVFVYGEAELVGDAVLAEYVDVNQLRPDWQQVLCRNGVDYVVFAAGKPLDAALAATGWQLAYQDSLADIFVRQQPWPADCG